MMLRRAVVACAMVTAAAFGKQYRAERFDVDLRLQPDSTVQVTETLVIRFESGSFSYVFRDLALEGTDGIRDLRASLDGAALGEGDGPGQVTIRQGRHEVQARWHFTPVENAVHTFGLTYTVEGVVRREEGEDAIRWRAVPGVHDYHIDAGSVTLGPGAATLVAAPQLEGFPTRAIAEEGAWRLEFAGIGPNRGVVLEARFRAGTATQAPPRWQARQQQREQRRHEGVIAGLVAFGVVVALGLLVLLGTRDPYRLPVMPPVLQTAPPEALPPALAARLTGALSTLRWGTLVELARRGVVRFEEQKGRFGSREHTIVRLPGAVALTPSEQLLLDKLFRAGHSDRVRMSEAGYRLQAAAGPFHRRLMEQLVEAGCYDQARLDRKSSFLRVGGWTMLAGFLIGVAAWVAAIQPASAAWFKELAVVIGASAGAMVAGFAWLMRGGAYSPVTMKGAEATARARGFRLWMREVVRDPRNDLPVDVFEPYLPYAAAFGLGTRWAKHFQKPGVPVHPEWYAPGTDGADFVGFMGSSGASGGMGGAGGAGGGGGGASGGGSSGAG